MQPRTPANLLPRVDADPEDKGKNSGAVQQHQHCTGPDIGGGQQRDADGGQPYDLRSARSGKALSARRGIIYLSPALQWGGIQIHVGGGPANLTDFVIVASSMPSGLRYM